MRDQETAFRYLTGAMTGGDHPDAVGRKFDADGAPLRCPGFTTLCHVAPGSDAFAALVAAQNRLKAGPLASAFAFLPAPSFHMTIFEGVIDYARTPERWPRHLQTDMTIADVTEDAFTRLQTLDVETEYKVRPLGIFAGFAVSMTGADPAQEDRLRRIRALLRDATNLHRLDHDAYQFHITLAYLLRWLSPEDARRVIDLSDNVADDLGKACGEIPLGPVELCRFDTMERFDPLMRL